VRRRLPDVTDLRYLPDSDDVTEFEATVTDRADDYVVLDGTYFYPGGGGQPPDCGTLAWPSNGADVRDTTVTVVDVEKNHGDVRHHVDDADELPSVGTTVAGRIDAERRDQLTRLHTAQHVVSRVVLDDLGAATVGNRVTPDGGWVEFDPSAADGDLATIERRTNAVIGRDLPVRKEERPREAVEAAVPDGRARLDSLPPSVDPLRVVEIGSFDRCPCGGTHVDRLGDVGTVRFTDRTVRDDAVRVAFELAP
jgi:misacylated tRNA(Ala) deacylase